MATTVTLTTPSDNWQSFCDWVTSTDNRIYLGWFGVLMINALLTATTAFILAIIAAPPVDIDGIREPVAGSFLQQIIFGFLGIHSDISGIYLNPSMPIDWDKIELINVTLGNGIYNILIQKGDVAKIELISGVADVPIYNQFAYRLN